MATATGRTQLVIVCLRYSLLVSWAWRQRQGAFCLVTSTVTGSGRNQTTTRGWQKCHPHVCACAASLPLGLFLTGGLDPFPHAVHDRERNAVAAMYWIGHHSKRFSRSGRSFCGIIVYLVFGLANKWVLILLTAKKLRIRASTF